VTFVDHSPKLLEEVLGAGKANPEFAGGEIDAGGQGREAGAEEGLCLGVAGDLLVGAAGELGNAVEVACDAVPPGDFWAEAAVLLEAVELARRSGRRQTSV
jgi:hypothetical protein